MSFNVGILAGIGERAREHQSDLLSQEAERRQRLFKFWSDQATHPDTRPEGQEVALQKAFTIAQTPYDKKLPRETENINDFLQVTPKMGESIEAPSSKSQTVPFPRTGPLPTAQSLEIPAPTPGPGVFAPLPARYSPQEKQSMGERALSRKEDIETEGAIRRERALAQARQEFAIEKPVLDIGAFGPDSSGLYEKTTGRVVREPNAPQSATEKSLQDVEVVLKSGGRTMAFFNPNPQNAGYFKKGPGGKLTDITDQVVGQYHQPSATVQILNASQPSAGMPSAISDALNRATMNMQVARRMQVVKSVNSMFDRGDSQAVRDTIRQAAVESEPVPVQQQIRGRREVLSALTDIRKLLKGVPTSLVAGTLEDTARRLGRTTDPKYVRIAQRLRVLNQSYRRSMTGAQFSIPEANEYASIFPSYSNTAPVNSTQIDSLMEAFAANDSVFWNFKLGPGWSDLQLGREQLDMISSPNQRNPAIEATAKELGITYEEAESSLRKQGLIK